MEEEETKNRSTKAEKLLERLPHYSSIERAGTSSPSSFAFSAFLSFVSAAEVSSSTSKGLVLSAMLCSFHAKTADLDLIRLKSHESDWERTFRSFGRMDIGDPGEVLNRNLGRGVRPTE